jgi:hypothetical protein
MRHEIGSEVELVSLGDERLNRRCRTLLETLAADPQASINAACQGWTETQAAYRFLDNDRVTEDAILHPHREATLERMRQHPVVLLIQDTTELDLTAHPPDGAGPLSSEKRLGFLSHTVLAATPERLPLGVLRDQTYARPFEGFGESQKRRHDPIETKEVFRWLEGYREACAVVPRFPGTMVVAVADREGDLYELFVEAGKHATPAEYVIRSGKNRNLLPDADDDASHPHSKLRDAVGGTPVVAPLLELQLGRTPGRAARTAVVEVRAGRLALQAPYRRTGKLPDMTVSVVWVHEPHPPAGVERLDWLLITSLPIESQADVLRVVEYYAARWTIEVFFRVLKTGCKVEDIQLETAARLLPCLMLYRIVAWRVMYVTMLGRECPELPCDALFTEAEWKSVFRIVRKTDPPPSAPSLQEFTLMLGELGGHNGRKHDAPPGPQAIWVGIRRMTDFAEAWLAFGPGSKINPLVCK